MTSPSERGGIAANQGFGYEKLYTVRILLDMLNHEKIISLIYQTREGNYIDDIEVKHSDGSIYRYQAKKNGDLESGGFGKAIIKEFLDNALHQYIKDLPSSKENKYIIVSTSNVPVIKDLEELRKLKHYNNLQELANDIASGHIFDWIQEKTTPIITNSRRGETNEIQESNIIDTLDSYNEDDVLQMLLKIEHLSRDRKTLYDSEDKEKLLKAGGYNREYLEVIKLILGSLVDDRFGRTINKQMVRDLCKDS